MISVIAKIPIKEGKMEEAIKAFKELMVQVAKEEGTVMYTLNQAKSNPNALVIKERYRDKAALDSHSASPQFKAFVAKGASFLGGDPR